MITDSGEVIARRVLAGEPWEKFMVDGIHPAKVGYDVHGRVIEEELDRQWALYQALPAEKRVVAAIACPKSTIFPSPWEWPHLVPAGNVDKTNGFKKGAHGRVKFIEGGPGASGTFAPPRGTVVGVLHQAADSTHSSGELEVRLDGNGEWTRLPLQNEPQFPEEDDRSIFFQRQFFGGYGLPPSGCHSLEFRVALSPDNAAARIVGFFVVEADPQPKNPLSHHSEPSEKTILK